MRIGIDAKWFFSGPPSGSYVVRNLIKKFLITYPEIDFYLIFRSKDKGKKLEFTSNNFILIYAKVTSNNLIWNSLISSFQLKKFKLDFVIFQNFSPIFSNFKKIAFIHDIIFKTHPEFFSLLERFYFFPLKFLSQRADLIITVSNNEKKRLLQFNYGNEKKIFVIYNGVSDNFKTKDKFPIDKLAEIKNKYNLPDNYMLYVGRLNIRKNIEAIIKALMFIDIKVTLVIVGQKNKLSDKFIYLAQKNKVEDRLNFTGYVKDEDLYPIYVLAKLFIFVPFEEGFGLPPLEAMKCGIPIVVSNTSCLPEICGTAGTYVDPYSPQEIAEKIMMLLNNNELRNKKIKIGLERASKFTWQDSVKKIYNVFELMYLKNEKIS